MKRFQDNAFNLANVNKTNCTNAFEIMNIKETTGECQGKKVFVNSDRTMNIRSNSCQQTTSSIPAKPSS